MCPYYKGGDGSVFHAMFPIEGAEETDGPIRSADGVDQLAAARLIKAEAVDGQPFKHCGICNQNGVSRMCRFSQVPT